MAMAFPKIFGLVIQEQAVTWQIMIQQCLIVDQLSQTIQCGNGGMLVADKIGKIRVNVKQIDGREQIIVLENYKYVPGLTFNLFSIIKALNSNWNISNEGI